MRSTRSYVLLSAVLVVMLGAASLAAAGGDGGKKNVRADRLSGYNEVPPVSTTGQGRFKAELDRDAGTITYELTFSGLTGAAAAAHLHFAQRDVNGDVVVPLCAPCTSPVTGTIAQANIVAVRGLDTFAELVSAIRAGRIYVNVHTAAFPGGEIRAQLNNRNRK